VRLVFTFFLLSALLPAASAASIPIEPGVVTPFRAGDELVWDGTPGGDRWLSAKGGPEGGRLSWQGTTMGDRFFELQPGHIAGSRLDLREGGRLVITARSGAGQVLLSGFELGENFEGNGTHAVLRHQGRLAPGACEAQIFSRAELGNLRCSRGVLWGPAEVEAVGANAHFRLIDQFLDVLDENTDVLSARLSAEALEGPESGMLFLQACAPLDASAEFTMRVTRTAEPAPERRFEVPFPLGLIPLGVALAVLLARRRTA
jgi:hypothetical protein